MIVFGEHDLTRRSPFPNIDLVVSRNVLIYFTPELQRRALQLFAYSLRNGGYLVLGKAETSSLLGEFLAPQHHKHKVYRRQGGRFLMPPIVAVNPPPKKSELGETPANLQPPPEPRRTRPVDESFLNRLPVGVVVVDQRYDIQAINATARRLLSIRGAAVGEDLLHTMQNVPYAEVRRAIDSAFRDGDSAGTDEFAVQDAATGETCHLRLICSPQRDEGERGMAETVVLVIEDVTEVARARCELEETRAELERFRREAQAESARQKTQSERLIEKNRQLEEANQELTSVNEDLQTAYEESLLTTEEAQASTEEVETLNEELQATNEELETLNEELQSTIEELNATNEDLSARSMEIKDLGRISEGERRRSEASRRRLEAIVQSISDAVLAVDAEGKVLLSNDVFKETFGEGEETDEKTDLLGDFAPLDENGESLPPEASPQTRAARGESFSMRFTIEGEDGTRRRFEARGRPTGSEDGDGVIVIREI